MATTGETAEAGEGTGDGGPDEADDACYAVEALEQIGSQWRLVVLHELQGSEARFNELKRATDASSRTLSRVLDDLQEANLVDRRMEEDAPVATYYSLTPKGEALCPVFDAVEEWAEEWLAGDAPTEAPADD